jgi:hypothetical protein
MIAAYLKTQVLSSTLDLEQYIAPMMFAYNTTYHRSIKSILFEVTFGLEPWITENPNPDLRRLYGEDLGTEMFQRLQNCQNLAKKLQVKITTNPLKSQQNILILRSSQ